MDAIRDHKLDQHFNLKGVLIKEVCRVDDAQRGVPPDLLSAGSLLEFVPLAVVGLVIQKTVFFCRAFF